MKFFFYFFCIISILFLSCKKEKLEPIINIEKSDNIIVIDTLCMHYDYFDTVNVFITGGYYSTNSTSFDFNNDNILDITISASGSYSPGGLSISNSFISTLHQDIEIQYFDKSDSLCSYQITSPYGSITYTENYNPNAIYSYPLVFSTNTDEYPVAYNHGDTLNLSSDFKNDSFILAYQNSTNTSWSGAGVATNIHYGLSPDQVDHYICFRLMDNRYKYIGWIRVRLSSSSSIHVLGYALSRIN